MTRPFTLLDAMHAPSKAGRASVTFWVVLAPHTEIVAGVRVVGTARHTEITAPVVLKVVVPQEMAI